MSFGFYSDPDLLVPFSGPLTAVQNADGSSAPVDFGPLYVGIPDSEPTTSAQATSNPGVDDIVLSIVDSAAGSGHESSEVKLAESSAGLDTATAGAPLNFGTEILKGAANKKTVYARVDDATGVVGTETELSLQFNDVTEL